MTRAIRMQPEGKICSMWADLQGTAPVLLAELRPQDPADDHNPRWYWITASPVFAHWLGNSRSVATLDHAEATGLRFLVYLVDLEDLLGVQEST